MGPGEVAREIRGSLHCARDGGAVPRFGRDDVVFIPFGRDDVPLIPASVERRSFYSVPVGMT